LELKQQAIEVLRTNNRNGYTVPTATGLYPAQWNWDSCFTALGLAQFDPPRAVVELETLFDGQWLDGMVPHILFRGDDSSYFPNASVWRRDRLGDPRESRNRSSRPPSCGASSSTARSRRSASG